MHLEKSDLDDRTAHDSADVGCAENGLQVVLLVLRSPYLSEKQVG